MIKNNEHNDKDKITRMLQHQNAGQDSDGDERAPSFIPTNDVGGARRVSELPPTPMFPLHVSRTRLDKDDSTESDEMAGKTRNSPSSGYLVSCFFCVCA